MGRFGKPERPFSLEDRMAVGFGVAFMGLVFLLIALATAVWLRRSLSAGEIGLIGGGLAPVIRRVRQPLKFWTAVWAVGAGLTLPATVLAYLFLRMIVIGLSE
jgi:hypothetical protein